MFVQALRWRCIGLDCQAAFCVVASSNDQEVKKAEDARID